MKSWIALFVCAFVAGAIAQECTQCATMKWAICDGPPCVCKIALAENMTQNWDCTKLVPKCYLMKAEMHRARKGLSTRTIGGKPDETAIVDNDGIYDPDCENDGRFKAKQCNQTQQCWCVNSAGVRRTDKGDINLKCDKLVETYWIRLQLTHKEASGTVNKDDLKKAITDVMAKRYMGFNPNMVNNFEYDPKGRMIVMDVQKAKGDRLLDLATIAYYMEKDVKVLPLFTDQTNFAVTTNGQNLQMGSILVYYVDEEPPTMTMQNLSGGIIAVIVVVILAVVAGFLIMFFARKKLSNKYNKTQQRENEAL